MENCRDLAITVFGFRFTFNEGSVRLIRALQGPQGSYKALRSLVKLLGAYIRPLRAYKAVRGLVKLLGAYIRPLRAYKAL